MKSIAQLRLSCMRYVEFACLYVCCPIRKDVDGYRLRIFQTILWFSVRATILYLQLCILRINCSKYGG